MPSSGLLASETGTQHKHCNAQHHIMTLAQQCHHECLCIAIKIVGIPHSQHMYKYLQGSAGQMWSQTEQFYLLQRAWSIATPERQSSQHYITI
jgi:hypothetical protein